MKWPLVSRREYDGMEQQAERWFETADTLLRNANALHADVREQRDYNRTLVQQIVQMRREGFAPLPTPHVPAPLLSSPVDDAILARANGNSRLRTHLMRQRDKLRKDGIDDDEITERLTTFRDPDPDE